MAADTKTDTSAKIPPTDEEIRAAALAKDDAEFVTIITQRYMYNADKCKDFPLVGYLLNRLPMPPSRTAIGKLSSFGQRARPKQSTAMAMSLT